MNVNVALNTLVFSGYSWEKALEETARLGVLFIEPVYISKYDPGLTEDYFTETNATKLSSQITRSGLHIRSLASHMDMGLKDTVDVFRRRMIFAKNIGSEIILTNTSYREHERQFYDNMQVLCGMAEELKLTIALENPGDGQGYIMNNAGEGARIIKKIGSDRVKLNYDFSNFHTLSKGKETYDRGLGDALPHIAHLHLKNVRQQDTNWLIGGLSEGIIDYKSLFREYPALLKLPMSIELPVRFAYDAAFDFVPLRGERPSLEQIHKIVQDSIRFLENNLIQQST